MHSQVNLIIVMGVSGCGKSSVAKTIAEELNYCFLEADDYHSDENKAHMASGKPLTDAMREPWIALLQAQLIQLSEKSQSVVMSFSGLRREHREKMRELPLNSLFIHLDGEQNLISQRMTERAGHYMPASLLDSQFAAMQAPSNTEQLHIVDIRPPLKTVIDSCKQVIQQELSI